VLPTAHEVTCDDRRVTLGGQFWSLEDPEKRVRGEFDETDDGEPEVRLEAALVADPRVRRFQGGMAFAASEALSVESFAPITLQGELDTGDFVTLLDARNHGSDGSMFGPLPRYVAQVAVVGTLVDGNEQRYSAVRFRVDHPYWLAHLNDGESSAVEDDGSTLSLQAADDGNWLLYESAAPEILHQLEMRVISGSLVLAALVLDRHDLVTRQTQARVNSTDPWLDICGPTWRSDSGKGIGPDTLLDRDELTVERCAQWIALNDRLDGLAWAIAQPLPGVLQVEALVATSLVEGLHRRLPYEQSKFGPDQKSALKRIRQAAIDAAAQQANTEGLSQDLVRELVGNAVGHVGDLSFRDRANAVVTEVCGAVPEIAESVRDLPGRLTVARNDIAHHLLLDHENEPLATRFLRWMVITYVTPWLLRCLLLLHAGIEPAVLRAGFTSSRRFGFFRANVAKLVSELGWELPSADG
jgi:hypothetical protein